MSEPVKNGFEEYTLLELQQMLRAVLEYAVETDKPFIKELVFEIDRRNKYESKESR